MSIANNIAELKNEIPDQVELVAVSKTKPNELILEAYNAGQRIFGENKVQELVRKHEELPNDIQWHMIGHLQRNKVKHIAPFVHLIHGIDSMRLLQEVNKQAAKNHRTIQCLLQVHIAQESTKFGFSIEEVEALLGSNEYAALNNVEVIGLMGMATYTTDEQQVSNEFGSLSRLYQALRIAPFPHTRLEVLSMGMSGDYSIAIKEGSTMVRVGSKIFGKRHYS